MIFTFFIMWYVISGIQKLTGLKLEEVMMMESDEKESDEASGEGTAVASEKENT